MEDYEIDRAGESMHGGSQSRVRAGMILFTMHTINGRSVLLVQRIMGACIAGTQGLCSGHRKGSQGRAHCWEAQKHSLQFPD